MWRASHEPRTWKESPAVRAERARSARLEAAWTKLHESLEAQVSGLQKYIALLETHLEEEHQINMRIRSERDRAEEFARAKWLLRSTTGPCDGSSAAHRHHA